MATDKFSAVWVSHTSLSDFVKCPRAYFLKNVYKNPKTGKKMQIMSPALALGQAVHEVVESLSNIPTDKRFSVSLIDRLDQVWKKVTGKKGGFTDESVEKSYRQRGEEMLRKLQENPGPLLNLSVKIKEDLPQFWLSEADNIILCGKIDWLEYLPDQDAVHIIDFKTSKREEESDSLQLPIYHLLVSRCQKRPAVKASYWYLGLDTGLVEKPLPNLISAADTVLKLAKQVKLARQLDRFKCPEGDGCSVCKPYDKVVLGEAELVGTNQYRQEVYILPHKTATADADESVIL